MLKQALNYYTPQSDKLTKDARKAFESGMTYGKWQAMNSCPVTVEKREETLAKGWKFCKRCGKPFKMRSHNQVYCDIWCQRNL